MTDDEDLIESDAPSRSVSKLRQRLELLVPPRVGRRFLGGVTLGALALGLVAGYLAGSTAGDDGSESTQSGTESGGSDEPRFVPYIPEGSPFDEGVVIFTGGAAVLTLDDLIALGERPLPQSVQPGVNVASALDGLCADPHALPPGPVANNGAVGAARFELTDAMLSELISPDLDVLAASTLRAEVQLAQTCADSDVLTVDTEGVLEGIGDEYASFTVRRTDPDSGAVTTGYVILVRVGGQLIEVSLTSEGEMEKAEGLTRTMRIAEAAVTRFLTG